MASVSLAVLTESAVSESHMPRTASSNQLVDDVLMHELSGEHNLRACAYAVGPIYTCRRCSTLPDIRIGPAVWAAGA